MKGLWVKRLLERLGLRQLPQPETWKPVVGCEGWYEVSSRGRVRSLKVRMWHGDVVRQSPLELTPAPHGWGNHPTVEIRSHGTRRRVAISHLMLEAFVGPRPPRYRAMTTDGNPQHLVVENLRWVPPIEIQLAKERRQRQVCATPQSTTIVPQKKFRPPTKLTPWAVAAIRARARTREPYSAMAREFGISVSTVSAVVRRRIWRHVP